MQNNAITWFEIPADNLGRASSFYEAVLDKTLKHETMGGREMALFPFDQTTGIGGCIVKDGVLQPAGTGSLVYLYADKDIDAVLKRVETAGGRVVLGKTALPGDIGHYAHIIDSEGNRVGLHAL